MHACAYVFVYIHKHMVCLEAQLDGDPSMHPRAQPGTGVWDLPGSRNGQCCTTQAQNLRIKSRSWIRSLGAIPSSPVLHRLQISLQHFKSLAADSKPGRARVSTLNERHEP